MLRFSRSKILATVGIVLLGLLLAVPSLMSREQREALQARLPSWIPLHAIVLGLDLQGGSHVLLEVDVPDLLRTQSIQLRVDVRRALRETGVGLEGGIKLLTRGVQIRVSDPAARGRLMPKVRELAQPVTNPILGQTGANTVAIN